MARIGNRVVASKPKEKVALETSKLAALEGQCVRLGPEELGLLAKRLPATLSAVEAARIKERLNCGFYGTW